VSKKTWKLKLVDGNMVDYDKVRDMRVWESDTPYKYGTYPEEEYLSDYNRKSLIEWIKKGKYVVSESRLNDSIDKYYVRPPDEVEPFEFEDSLVLLEIRANYRSGARAVLKRLHTGKIVFMFLSELNDCLPLDGEGLITGRFGFRKQGSNYSVTRLSK